MKGNAVVVTNGMAVGVNPPGVMVGVAHGVDVIPLPGVLRNGRAVFCTPGVP